MRVNRKEAVLYLGFRGRVPDELTVKLLDKYEDTLLSAITPRFVYKIYDNIPSLLIGNDIKELLKNSEKIVLFAATLGIGVDKLIRMTEINDMAGAVVIDAMASALIEQYNDIVENEINENFPKLHRTSRFSPGYGDLPIQIQSEFLNMIDSVRKIGLTTNNSNLLIPTKSVTAIFGLNKSPEINKPKCENCNNSNSCKYKETGEPCGL